MKKNKNKKNILLILLGYLLFAIGILIATYGVADFILGNLGIANLTFFLGGFLSMFGPIICFIVGGIVTAIGYIIKE
tara:strand:+ start:147 stop:377 length:231 start_codon:yes stop_codon:yes gene_type:complete